MNVEYEEKSDTFINFWLLNNPLSIAAECKQYHPPEESYFTDENHLFNRKLRKIYEGQNSFISEELKLIDDFIDTAEQADEPIVCIKSDILRFIYLVNLDISLAYSLSKKNQDFMKSLLPIKLTKEMQKVFELKLVYTFGRDCFFRPIVIFNMEKFYKENLEIDLKPATIFLFDYIVKYMLLPGQIENIDLILKMNESNTENKDKDNEEIIRLLTELLVSNYPFRISTIFIKNIETDLYQKLKGNSSLVGIDIFSYERLKDFINPEQLEEKFGGEAENLDNNTSFIPFNPSKNFHKKEGGLIPFNPFNDSAGIELENKAEISSSERKMNEGVNANVNIAIQAEQNSPIVERQGGLIPFNPFNDSAGIELENKAEIPNSEPKMEQGVNANVNIAIQADQNSPIVERQGGLIPYNPFNDYAGIELENKAETVKEAVAQPIDEKIGEVKSEPIIVAEVNDEGLPEKKVADQKESAINTEGRIPSAITEPEIVIDVKLDLPQETQENQNTKEERVILQPSSKQEEKENINASFKREDTDNNKINDSFKKEENEKINESVNKDQSKLELNLSFKEEDSKIEVNFLFQGFDKGNESVGVDKDLSKGDDNESIKCLKKIGINNSQTEDKKGDKGNTSLTNIKQEIEKLEEKEKQQSLEGEIGHSLSEKPVIVQSKQDVENPNIDIMDDKNVEVQSPEADNSEPTIIEGKIWSNLTQGK